MMLMHLCCLVLRSWTTAWRKTKYCSLKAASLSSASTRGSLRRLFAGNETEKKLWAGAEWDVRFQSWGQHTLSGKLWLCGWNLGSEGMSPHSQAAEETKEEWMPFFHFFGQPLVWPKHWATWLYGSLALQAPIRNLVQPSHFTDGKTKL